MLITTLLFVYKINIRLFSDFTYPNDKKRKIVFGHILKKIELPLKERLLSENGMYFITVSYTEK